MPRPLWICVTFLSLTRCSSWRHDGFSIYGRPQWGWMGASWSRVYLRCPLVSGIVFICSGPFSLWPACESAVLPAPLDRALFLARFSTLSAPRLWLYGPADGDWRRGRNCRHIRSSECSFCSPSFGGVRGHSGSRRVAEHRRWMIRAYAIGLGVATVRPIVGVFFATSRITHLTPRISSGSPSG